MLYIANDVEAAGKRLDIHPTLSFGAAVMTREPIPFKEYWQRGLVFYTELQPGSLAYEREAMKVACSQLVCLRDIKKRDPRYDSSSSDFSPELVLRYMEKMCEHPGAAMYRFQNWIYKVHSDEPNIVGVVDTTFFDSGRINLLLGRYCAGPSPYGHKGLDLASVYCGFTRRPDAKLKELGVADERDKPHRADQDSVWLAQVGRELLFEKMGW